MASTVKKLRSAANRAHVEFSAAKSDVRGDDIPNAISVLPTRRLEGVVTAPPSKSYSHRALMVAGLCNRDLEIENALLADDIGATLDAWTSLGASIQYDRKSRRFHVHGVRRPQFPRATNFIYVRESGTTLRFVLPGLAFCPRDRRVIVKGSAHGSLKSRTNDMIVHPLSQQLGMRIAAQGDDNRIPLTVHGLGQLPSANIRLRGDKSSQVVSSFLLWLPLAAEKNIVRKTKSHIYIDGVLVSKPYVDITIDVLEWAGIRIDQPEPGSHYVVPAGQKFEPKSRTFRVPGDYSSAAFLLAAACLVPSMVTVRDLKVDDKQGDRAIVKILRNMGAILTHERDEIRVAGPQSLRGIELDCSEIPDLVPILCVLGAFSEGRMVLKNIAHLRHKESDRLAGPTEELRKMGASISHSSNSITVEKSHLMPSRVNARGDHRLAMSLAVAGLAAGGAEVSGAPSMNKSYPNFIKDMRSIGARILTGND